MLKKTSIIMVSFLVLFCIASLLAQTKTSAIQEKTDKEVLEESTILKVSDKPTVIILGKIEEFNQVKKQADANFQGNKNMKDSNTSLNVKEKIVNKSQGTFDKDLEMKTNANPEENSTE